MTLTRRDLAATVLTALAVLVFAAVHQGWNVPLVGDSVRWATVAVLVLGMGTCALGSPSVDRGTRVLAALGIAALALAIVALVTGSLTALSLLVADYVALWAVSTFRHALQGPRRAVAT